MKMQMLWSGLCLSLTINSSALAVAADVPSVRDAPDVSDESYQVADGRRVLQESTTIAASPHQIWMALTTSDGFSSWAVAFAQIDLRIGGIMESSYRPGAKPGDPDNIKNEIIAFAPDRMLAMRNVQAPPQSPFDVPVFQSLETVILIDPLPGGRSRVTTIQPDYLSTEKYSAIYDFFRIGNAITLESLKRHFEKGSN